MGEREVMVDRTLIGKSIEHINTSMTELVVQKEIHARASEYYYGMGI